MSRMMENQLAKTHGSSVLMVYKGCNVGEST